METWKIQAILAAIFAGLTSVLAKSGMKNLGPDVSLALRTCVVFTIVMLNMLVWTAAKPLAAMRSAQPRDLALLALSGVTTSLSWIFYYRAMKTGPSRSSRSWIKAASSSRSCSRCSCCARISQSKPPSAQDSFSRALSC